MSDFYIRSILYQEETLISEAGTLLIGQAIILKGIHDYLVVSIDSEFTTI